tara:strand:+ start:39538 stop:39954 length:417 start_codon:yes stop_codon:yes gene_type:complete
MAKPIVLRSFLNPNDAQFAKLILEDAGIPVYLYDEQTSGSTVSYSYALGGIKIVVPDHFAESALEILNTDFEESTKQRAEEESIECPKCNSTQVYKKSGYTSFIELILFFFSGIFFMYKKQTKYKCRTCKYIWQGYGK